MTQRSQRKKAAEAKTLRMIRRVFLVQALRRDFTTVVIIEDEGRTEAEGDTSAMEIAKQIALGPDLGNPFQHIAHSFGDHQIELIKEISADIID